MVRAGPDKEGSSEAPVQRGALPVAAFVAQVNACAVDVVAHTEQALTELAALDEQHHFFTVMTPELARAQAQAVTAKIAQGWKGRLAGVPLSVKDCLCVEGVLSQAGSKALEGYAPVFSATAVQRCIDEGAIIVGKTSQDEFGFGSFSTNVGIGFAVPTNPHDPSRACGGSSGGSAGVTALTRLPHLSIAESTGGSIASPASFCGVAGLCPTYGQVSRYGLLDYANSLDKIGSMGKSVDDAALLLSVMAGHDTKDSTSLPDAGFDYSAIASTRAADGLSPVEGLRIGVLADFFGEGVLPEVRDHVQRAAQQLADAGARLKSVSLPLTAKQGVGAYYMTAVTEASTNLAKYCGIRYGHAPALSVDEDFNASFTRARSESFGTEAKRRIMLGTFARMAGYRDAYYIRAAKVRTLILREYEEAFSKVDVLLCPTMPVLPPRFDEIAKLTPLQNYLMDIMTVGPNLAGLPHLSVPCGWVAADAGRGSAVGGAGGSDTVFLPVGCMLISPHKREDVLVQAGRIIRPAPALAKGDES